jgi:hypothetical protein
VQGGLHRVMEVVDVASVMPDQKRCQVMVDHRLGRMSAAPDRVGIPRALEAIGERQHGGDDLEVGLKPVPGVLQRFVERQSEQTRFDSPDIGSDHGMLRLIPPRG